MAQHLSVRVPWKDNGYTGLICNRPCYNNSCLRLKNIAGNRDDKLENSLSGQPIKGHEAEIPCLSEGGCFMSHEGFTKTTVHPYKKSNPKTHGHFLETELHYPPFSFPCRPFAWMMLNKGGNKNNMNDIIEKHAIDFDAKREPALNFKTNWVQDAENHRAIFDAFYEEVEIGNSLVIPYAKQVPFIDEPGRIVMGVGRITSLTEPPEHNHTEDGKLRSMTWETMVGHSIRDNCEDGFLMPYYEMMEYAKEHKNFDIRSITVFAEDEYFDEFSYASEHLSYDAVINVLLQIIRALKIVREHIPGNWDRCISWTEDRLREVWNDRGPFPGLGVMLHTVGFEYGEKIAKEIKKHVSDISEYQEVTEKILSDPGKYLSDKINASLRNTELETFFSLPDERKQLFWLMSRISLTREQAFCLFFPEQRSRIAQNFTDADIIANPYILYEKTRRAVPEESISINKIDMAIYPPEEIRMNSPLCEPSVLESANDKRRIRAYIISILEKRAVEGHTAYPVDRIVREVGLLPIDPQCNVTTDILNAISEFIEEEIHVLECTNGEKAFQLSRLYKIDEVIRKSVDKRLKGKKHNVKEDWGRILNREFAKNPNLEDEKKAFEERAAILKELADSRLSVLTGGAGTGKTTLLTCLCKCKEIQNGGILLLAPTGKASVRMSQAMHQHGVDITAKTVAQFLNENHRFNGRTMEYHLSEKEAIHVPETVIVDESSMLTEEMFGALIQAFRKSAKRIIFVGDINQLPPIGAGRPFVDLVKKLEQDVNGFPKVGNGYGKLTVNMRQKVENVAYRDDIELSKWYTSDATDLDDGIFSRLQSGEAEEYIVFKKWSTPEELEEKIYETLVEETCMKDADDVEGFNLSIGGVIESGWMNFKGHTDKLEDWQILSAHRNNAAVGTATINRYIHERYRSQKSKTLENCKIRGTRNLLGTDGIIYGDKVINIRNHSRYKYDYINSKSLKGYVANGEIGIVNIIVDEKDKKFHQISFSSQPEYRYSWKSVVSEESNVELELAYALTVHKAQGSEFKKAILIVDKDSNLLSKELLYAAITRQKEKLVILYNDDAISLKDYSTSRYSAVVKRITSLFAAPDITEENGNFYENRMIHRTLKGESVRSKSEVIIANMLYQKGIEYEYEKKLDLGEDGVRVPDFTIEDAESGETFYWEHCGMLSNDQYSERWRKKQDIYRRHGITEGDNLIVSVDDMYGGIDSIKIEELIEQYLE